MAEIIQIDPNENIKQMAFALTKFAINEIKKTEKGKMLSEVAIGRIAGEIVEKTLNKFDNDGNWSVEFIPLLKSIKPTK